MSLLATLAGLGTALYLERARDAAMAPTSAAAEDAITPPATAPVIPASVATTSDTHDPLTAAAAIPEPPPLEQSADSPERQGGTSSPPAAAAPASTATIAVTPPPAVAAPPLAIAVPPVAAATPAATAAPATQTAATPPPATQTALLETAPEHDTTSAIASPSAAETATPSGRYWVEYAVYAGERPAKRLQRALIDKGVDSVVVPTHTPDGRRLLRVRSSRPLDYSAAKAASAKARQALKLSALIHRGSPLAGPAVAQESVASTSRGYWVQFGAFPRQPQAARLQQQLARGGIATAVSAMRGTSGRTLYRVRSLPLPDRDSAIAVVARAQQAGNSDFLVGQSVARPAPVAEPDRSQSEPVIDSVPYRAAESLPLRAR